MVSAGGRTALEVQFQPGPALNSRTLYCPLRLLLEDYGELEVPVVACVAGGGAAGQLADMGTAAATA